MSTNATLVATKYDYNTDKTYELHKEHGVWLVVLCGEVIYSDVHESAARAFIARRMLANGEN